MCPLVLWILSALLVLGPGSNLGVLQGTDPVLFSPCTLPPGCLDLPGLDVAMPGPWLSGPWCPPGIGGPCKSWCCCPVPWSWSMAWSGTGSGSGSGSWSCSGSWVCSGSISLILFLVWLHNVSCCCCWSMYCVLLYVVGLHTCPDFGPGLVLLLFSPLVSRTGSLERPHSVFRLRHCWGLCESLSIWTDSHTCLSSAVLACIVVWNRKSCSGP